MKCFYLVLLILVIFQSCKNNDINKETSLNVENTHVLSQSLKEADTIKPCLYIKGGNKHDFGTINENKIDVIPIDLEIGNTGNTPMVIFKVDVSCGCVSVDYPKEPILSGKTATLKIKIATKGQQGHFNKAIFLNSNAANDVELIRITGQIN